MEMTSNRVDSEQLRVNIVPGDAATRTNTSRDRPNEPGPVRSVPDRARRRTIVMSRLTEYLCAL
jgi:hypothetical protein